MWKNVDVNDHNAKVLQSMSGEQRSYTSLDKVMGTDCGTASILKNLTKDGLETCGLVQQLTLAVDLPVEMVLNEKKPDGLTNATLGIVKALDRHIIWVEFSNPDIGAVTRKQHSTAQTMREKCNAGWTPIFQATRDWPYGEHSDAAGASHGQDHAPCPGCHA